MRIGIDGKHPGKTRWKRLHCFDDGIFITGNTAIEHEPFQFPFVDDIDPAFGKLLGIFTRDFDMTLRSEVPQLGIDVDAVLFLFH